MVHNLFNQDSIVAHLGGFWWGWVSFPGYYKQFAVYTHCILCIYFFVYICQYFPQIRCLSLEIPRCLYCSIGRYCQIVLRKTIQLPLPPTVKGTSIPPKLTQNICNLASSR